MYCGKCGAALPDEAKFCGSCGAAVARNADGAPLPAAGLPAPGWGALRAAGLLVSLAAAILFAAACLGGAGGYLAWTAICRATFLFPAAYFLCGFLPLLDTAALAFLGRRKPRKIPAAPLVLAAACLIAAAALAGSAYGGGASLLLYSLAAVYAAVAWPAAVLSVIAAALFFLGGMSKERVPR